MSKYQVTIADTGERYRCDSEESLLEGMAKLGKKGIPLGCRGGGCGVCKVAVTQGEFRKKPMSRCHVSLEDEAEKRLLACRVFPCSDVEVEVLGKMKAAVLRPPKP